jgi:hypothetical protein
MVRRLLGREDAYSAVLDYYTVQSGNWAEVKGEEGNNSSLYLS